jgi:hypothetical protein
LRLAGRAPARPRRWNWLENLFKFTVMDRIMTVTGQRPMEIETRSFQMQTNPSHIVV